MAGLTSLSTTVQAGADKRTRPFKYESLGKEQIRLLRLEPASQNTDQLQGELIPAELQDLLPRQNPFSSGPHEPIDPDKHIYFEAISYVWGEGTFTEYLITPEGYIRITASLASILRRLRDYARPRCYWADGVCINQDDTTEKEIQVPLMGDIYGSAARILCDICEDERYSLLLDAMTRYWKRNIRHGLGFDASTGFSSETTARIMGVSLPTEEEADSIQDIKGKEWSALLLKLMLSPWFHRLWIVQEFMLGRDVSMIFGHRVMSWGEVWAGTVRYLGGYCPWDAMRPANENEESRMVSFSTMCLIRTWRIIDPETPHGREFNTKIKLFMCGMESGEANLALCLMYACSKDVKIPRDRYFGILGLVDEGSKKKSKDLRVDYTSPMRDITMRFWTYTMQSASGGELILCTGLQGRNADWPSWLRDISVPDPLLHVWQYGPMKNPYHKAGGEPRTWSATFDGVDPDRMFVQGYLLDEIAETESYEPNDFFGLEPLAKWLEKALDFFTSGNQSTGQTGHVQEAALKVLCDYNKLDLTPPQDERFKAILELGLSLVSTAKSHLATGREKISRMKALVKEQEDIERDLFIRVFFMRKLRLCKTSKDMLSYLPKDVCIGDTIWILKGCRLPVVLRPHPSHQRSFEVVGGGYVYGMMNGEVMEKPGFQWKEVSLR